MRKILLLISALMLAVCAFAEGTRTWEQSTFEQFEKGTARGVAIRSDGALELAPAFAAVTTTPSTYIWSIAADKHGAVYAAAGAPARVYRIAPDGTTTIIFQPQELQVQALAVDSSGSIYAATSPDGKVYKIEHRPGKTSPQKHEAKPAATSTAAETGDERVHAAVDPNWVSSVFYEPKTKYIWDLALDREGRLYIATGDQGQIFRVDKNGKGSVFFKSDEAHIRVLAFDPKGNLIAGSDGSGLIYRISPDGNAFVLYSAPKKEITALAIDSAGNIYAAGVGEKRPATPPPGVPTTIAPSTMVMPATTPATPGMSALGASPIPFQFPANFPLPGLGAVGSEVYQIAPDGSPRRIWSSRDDLVYALAFSPNGALLAGTGNKGRIFSIRGEDEFTDLLKASATQVTHFAKAPGGGLYVSTSNLGKIFLLGAQPGAEGTYQSDVFDAHIFSRWGRAQVRARGNYELWARSGNVDNPDRNWSPWRKVDVAKDAPLEVPAARFIQWRAVLHPNPAPVIDSVLLNYLPKNVAPVLGEITVQVGARVQPLPKVAQNTALMTTASNTKASAQPPEIPVPVVRDRDSIAVHWTARDDNNDELVYSLYYRGDGETRWKLLKDDLSDPYYSFDAGLLPDGGYTIKVVASDAPSHSPDEALTDERESRRFEVDTTPPRIEDLHAAVEGDQLRITFSAADGFSVIKRAEYSVDAGDWQYVEPVGHLSDAKVENYDFAARVPQSNPATLLASNGKNGKAAVDDPPVARNSAEHLVVVRVWDRFDNVATAKTVIHAK